MSRWYDVVTLRVKHWVQSHNQLSNSKEKSNLHAQYGPYHYKEHKLFRFGLYRRWKLILVYFVSHWVSDKRPFIAVQEILWNLLLDIVFDKPKFFLVPKLKENIIDHGQNQIIEEHEVKLSCKTTFGILCFNKNSMKNLPCYSNRSHCHKVENQVAFQKDLKSSRFT